MPTEEPSRAKPSRPRHALAFVLALAVAALGHAAAIGLLPVGAGAGWGGGVQRSLQVRQIVVEPPAPTPAPPPAVVPPAPPPPTPRLEPLAERPVPMPLQPASAPEPPMVVAAAEPVPAAAASVPAVPAVDGGGKPLPVYPTKPAPSAKLEYELRRGALRGSGELVWSAGNGRYSITLEGTAFALTLLSQRSEGGFDSAGLAPDRFLDRRRGKSVQAANFQRDAGKITFSGPPVEYPLVPGAQDRVSWMLQLGAIIAADPQRFGHGAEITMFIVGARGEGDVWTFEVETTEPQDVPAGRVAAALRLKRQPRRPFDQLIEVWLDPARSYLPVRVRQSTPQTGDTFELLLAEAPR